MRDLKSSFWIKAKGALFLVLGIASGALLIWDHPAFRTVLLLAICIWAFCRAYYFAFYVIQNYVDPGYRFSGLIDFARYLWSGKSGRDRER